MLPLSNTQNRTLRETPSLIVHDTAELVLAILGYENVMMTVVLLFKAAVSRV